MTSDQPRIGIPIRLSTEGHAVDVRVRAAEDATRAIACLIQQAGGQPVFLHPGHFDAVEECSAFVLPGGGDVDPTRYGGPAAHSTLFGVDTAQDEFDVAVARNAFLHRRPLLAICRGMQLVNVMCGGTLHVDLPATPVHHRPAADKPHAGDIAWSRHLVDLHGRTADAYLGQQVLTVPCSHHQAIDRLGAKLTVTSTAADGFIEGIELTEPDFWMVGVQWHPEEAAAHPRIALPLFTALVQAGAAATRDP